MKQLFLLLLAVNWAGTVAQAPVQYPRLSKTLDSLAYVDQWPMQQLVKQLPGRAGRDLLWAKEAHPPGYRPCPSPAKRS